MTYYVDVTMFSLILLANILLMILGLGMDRIFLIVDLILDIIFGIYIESSSGFQNILFSSQAVPSNPIPLSPYDYIFLGFTLMNVITLIIRLR